MLMIRGLFCSVLIACCAHFAAAQVISIAAARSLPAGSEVTVRGIVTNGAELGKVRFLQDGTAGIAAYPGSGSEAGFEQNVTAGDSLEITGILVFFQGLLEISPISNFQVIASGQPLPPPKPVSLNGLSAALQGQRVSINCLSFAAAGGTFSASGTYGITDAGGGSGAVYVSSSSALLGDPIPAEPITLTAILSQYDDFQLLPRSAADFAPATCFYFLEEAQQTDLQTDGFTIAWQTNLPSAAKLRYGLSPDLGDELNLPGNPATAHLVQLTGLQPGTIYWLQAVATHNGETILSAVRPFATQSLSSGQIKVWFNHSIDVVAAGGLLPEGQSFQSCLSAIIARIDSAEQTLDVALYNNNRTDITNAIKLAHARGVRVRYVAAQSAASQALQPPPLFLVVYGNEEAIMHDKFLVIDADLPDQAWVMSGSMNWTTGNLTNDFNNLLFIQDQSLARAYELEFEEMWGSDGAFPSLADGRFGSTKRDNTPHQFIIGSSRVESYFSPSDQVTAQIVKTIQTADNEAQFALFSFTHNALGDALVERFNAGADIRGSIENLDDPGCEYDQLLLNGVSVQPHDAFGELHHKYAVVDAYSPGSDPTVVTGSHNWSYNAETANDENTLIIHDADIARLFAAEFEQRWTDLTTSADVPASLAGWKISPNPVSDWLSIQAPEALPELVAVRITDALGRQKVLLRAASQLDVSMLPAGLYWLELQTTQGVSVLPLQKM